MFNRALQSSTLCFKCHQVIGLPAEFRCLPLCASRLSFNSYFEMIIWIFPMIFRTSINQSLIGIYPSYVNCLDIALSREHYKHKLIVSSSGIHNPLFVLLWTRQMNVTACDLKQYWGNPHRKHMYQYETDQLTFLNINEKIQTINTKMKWNALSLLIIFKCLR